jgi:hypothetical protein
VMNLDADMNSKIFAFRENEVRINNLRLSFDGSVQTTEESILMDMSFASVNNEFKDIISLIPVIYRQNFDDIESSGSMSLNGLISGEYRDEILPKINIDLAVDNGRFQYPDLPVPVNNVNMKMNVSNPGGDADNTVINISNLRFELGAEPFEARLLVRNPATTPFIDTRMKGRLDLAQLKNALHLEGVTELAGLITADFEAKGTMAAADQKAIENMAASGTISVNNIIYNTDDLQDPINVVTGNLVLTPKRFNLSNMVMRIGRSDLRAEGELENMISYVLGDGTISGNLS